MWEQIMTRLGALDPSVIKSGLMAIAGVLTSLISSLMGEHQSLFYWLFGFVVTDYVTGIVAAARTGTWSSRCGLKGLIRKFVILLIAIGFHGIDQILNEPWIGAWAIGALSLNEFVPRSCYVPSYSKIAVTCAGTSARIMHSKSLSPQTANG